MQRLSIFITLILSINFFFNSFALASTPGASLINSCPTVDTVVAPQWGTCADPIINNALKDARSEGAQQNCIKTVELKTDDQEGRISLCKAIYPLEFTHLKGEGIGKTTLIRLFQNPENSALASNNPIISVSTDTALSSPGVVTYLNNYVEQFKVSNMGMEMWQAIDNPQRMENGHCIRMKGFIRNFVYQDLLLNKCGQYGLAMGPDENGNFSNFTIDSVTIRNTGHDGIDMKGNNYHRAEYGFFMTFV